METASIDHGKWNPYAPVQNDRSGKKRYEHGPNQGQGMFSPTASSVAYQQGFFPSSVGVPLSQQLDETLHHQSQSLALSPTSNYEHALQQYRGERWDPEELPVGLLWRMMLVAPRRRRAQVRLPELDEVRSYRNPILFYFYRTMLRCEKVLRNWRVLTELRRDGASYLRQKVFRRFVKHSILRPWHAYVCIDRRQ